MKRIIVMAALAAAAIAGLAKEAAPIAEDPALEQRLIAISEEMRCLVCQNESLAGSRAELAQDLRREMRELIRAGRSDAQIRDYMVARYGDFVLYRPPVKPTTWLLWAGPFVLLALALAGFITFLRRGFPRVADAKETA
jgi:cytochrome c-type biogenesis protein CcmH